MKPSIPLFAFVTLSTTSTVLAGESPYNPNAKPAPPPDYYYVCVAQSRDNTTRYVSSLEAAPKPYDPKFEGTVSQAWGEYLAKTLGANKVMLPHCSVGAGEKQMQNYRSGELNSLYTPKKQQVDWKYGQNPPTQ